MGESQPVKPQIGLCCNALLTRKWPPGQGLCMTVVRGVAGPLWRPSGGHNALFWINLTLRKHAVGRLARRSGLVIRGGTLAGAARQGNKIMATLANVRRTRRLAPALAGVAALFAALAMLTGQASAQGAVRSVHGDWQIRCETPPGAQTEQCALMQSVTAEDRPNVGLTVIVLKTSDQKSRLMRVVAPLGVLIPSGLGLKIDNQDVGRAGFVRCLPNGCVAEVVMDDNLINQLRNGQTSTFIIFQTPEEGIGFPMSLKGFGEGYDKLP
jgi:invasion protein IalB